MDREALRKIFLDALIRAYSVKKEKNPEWKFKEWIKVEEGQYPIPEYIPRTQEEMEEDDCLIVVRSKDEDGEWCSSIRALSYREVVETILNDLEIRGILNVSR